MPVNRNTTSVTGQTAAAAGISASQSGTANTALLLNGSLASTGNVVPSNASTIVVPPENPLSAGSLASIKNAGRGEPVSGTAVVLPGAQPVLITSAGNDSAATFAIVGLGPSGEPITEVLAGANVGVATSANFFTVVYSVTPSANTAAAVTVGTGTVVYSPWLILGSQRNHFDSHVRTFISGTVNYDVQGTTDPALLRKSGGQCDDLIQLLATQTGNTSSYPNEPLIATRIKLNSGTGTVTLRYNLSRTA